MINLWAKIVYLWHIGYRYRAVAGPYSLPTALSSGLKVLAISRKEGRNCNNLIVAIYICLKNSIRWIGEILQDDCVSDLVDVLGNKIFVVRTPEPKIHNLRSRCPSKENEGRRAIIERT